MEVEDYLGGSRLYRRLGSGPHGQLLERYAARLVEERLVRQGVANEGLRGDAGRRVSREGNAVRSRSSRLVIVVRDRIRSKRDNLGYCTFCCHPVAARGKHSVKECALGGGDLAPVRERPHKMCEGGERLAVVATGARGRLNRTLTRLRSGEILFVIVAHKVCFHGIALKAPCGAPAVADALFNCRARHVGSRSPRPTGPVLRVDPRENRLSLRFGEANP
jgi:hypothetical protein